MLIEFQKALKEIIDLSVQPNATMQRIIFDYSNYHAIMVMLSGMLLILFGGLGFRFWLKLRKSPKQANIKWHFEKKANLYFMSICIFVGLFMLLLVIANTSNTINPLKGLKLAYLNTQDISIDTENSHVSYSDSMQLTLQQAFSGWIQAGDGVIPTPILNEMEKRVEFHSNKAFKSFILMCAFIGIAINRWKVLLKNAKSIQSGIRPAQWGVVDKFNFIVGNSSIGLALLSMIIVVANIQGAFAPLTAFLVGFL